MAIIAVMSEFDRPMTSAELYAIFDGERSLKAIEYHLSTLVEAKVAEVVYGLELSPYKWGRSWRTVIQ